MTTVSRRAHRRHDRAGDPLDGLVNLFDLGIVLAVGFLLAALSSLDLTGALTSDRQTERPSQQGGRDQVRVPQDSTVDDVPSDGQRVIGHGRRVGEVYRLADGRLVYVVPKDTKQ